MEPHHLSQDSLVRAFAIESVHCSDFFWLNSGKQTSPGPPISTYVPHLAFYLWYHIGPSTEQPVIDLPSQVAHIVNARGLSEWTVFYKKVVPATIGSESLVNFVWRVLTQDPALHGDSLSTAMALMNPILFCKLPHGESSSKKATILRALAIASQRHVCTGEWRDSDDAKVEKQILVACQ